MRCSTVPGQCKSKCPVAIASAHRPNSAARRIPMPIAQSVITLRSRRIAARAEAGSLRWPQPPTEPESRMLQPDPWQDPLTSALPSTYTTSCSDPDFSRPVSFQVYPPAFAGR